MQRIYSNDKIAVYWDSKKCMHSGVCFTNLPAVFAPRKRPWVNIDAADCKEIKRVVDQCPSRALTCKLHDKSAA